jgi:hypothetical protein
MAEDNIYDKEFRDKVINGLKESNYVVLPDGFEPERIFIIPEREIQEILDYIEGIEEFIDGDRGLGRSFSQFDESEKPEIYKKLKELMK